MLPFIRFKNIIFSVLLVIAIAMAFLLPWLFVKLNSKTDFYGLYTNKAAHDFKLTNTNGKPVTLASLSGQYVYLMFGFSRCQEVCPVQLGNLLAIKELYGEASLKFAFITLDPDRDTEEVLRQYFEIHGDEFIALRTESMQSSQALAMKYHEYAYLKGQKKANSDYEINHNGYLFLLNPEGILKLIYTSAQLDPVKVVEDLKKIRDASKREVKNESRS